MSRLIGDLLALARAQTGEQPRPAPARFDEAVDGAVRAARGKTARAEPVALKFETGKAFFAGRFPELEAELGGLVAGGGYEGPGRSPDRADAMVWAMTVLSQTRSQIPRVTRL